MCATIPHFSYHRLRAERVDIRVAEEIRMSLSTGVLRNENNSVYHRMGKAIRRTDARVEKGKQAKAFDDKQEHLQKEIDDAAQEKKAADDRLKKAKAAKASQKIPGRRQYKAESSSSGRVKGKGTGRKESRPFFHGRNTVC